MAPSDDAINRRLIALNEGLNIAVGQIAYPTRDIERLRDHADGFAIANTLYTAADDHTYGYRVHSSAETFLLRLVLTTARVFFSPMRRSLEARVGLVAKRFFGT